LQNPLSKGKLSEEGDRRLFVEWFFVNLAISDVCIGSVDDMKDWMRVSRAEGRGRYICEVPSWECVVEGWVVRGVPYGACVVL